MRGKYQFDSSFIGSTDFAYLVAEHGCEAFGVYSYLCSLLWQQDNSKYQHKDLKKVSAQLRIAPEKLEAILNTLITEGLFASDGEAFWCHAVNEEVTNLLAKSESARKAVAAREAKRTPPLPTPDDVPLSPDIDRSSTDHHPLSTCSVSVSDSVGLEIIKIDDFGKEQVLMTWKSFGLGEEDLPQGLIELTRHYRENPHKKKPGSQGLDLCSSWLTRILLARKNEQEKYHRNKAPPKEDMAAGLKRLSDKIDAGLI